MDNQTIPPKTSELKHFCKLYHGEQNNPYNPNCTTLENWALEYLKYQIWDAEKTFVFDYNEWHNIWSSQNNGCDIDTKNEPLSVYRFVIGCKLGKMHRDDIDFEMMYLNL